MPLYIGTQIILEAPGLETWYPFPTDFVCGQVSAFAVLLWRTGLCLSTVRYFLEITVLSLSRGVLTAFTQAKCLVECPIKRKLIIENENAFIYSYRQLNWQAERNQTFCMFLKHERLARKSIYYNVKPWIRTKHVKKHFNGKREA